MVLGDLIAETANNSYPCWLVEFGAQMRLKENILDNFINPTTFWFGCSV